MYWRFLFNTEENRLQTRKTNINDFTNSLSLKLGTQLQAENFVIWLGQNTQTKIFKFWKWRILIMQVTQDTLCKSFCFRTCSDLKRDPETVELSCANYARYINKLLLERKKN